MCRLAAAGCSRLLPAEGWHPSSGLVHDFGPSIRLAPVLGLARVRRRRPCELTRGDRGAASIRTDRARCRAVLSCGQRAVIAHFGCVVSAGARPSAPPRWRGLVGWRQRRGAGCWRAHGAVRDRSPGQLVGRGGSGVPSAEIALGRELSAYAAQAEARGGSTMPGLNTCRASAACGCVGSEPSAARHVC